MFALIGQTFQFLVDHALVRVVNRFSRLPRGGVQPDVEWLLRGNLALKAQVRALVLELKAERGSRPKVSMRTRAAQVSAHLLTRGSVARNAGTRGAQCLPQSGHRTTAGSTWMFRL